MSNGRSLAAGGLEKQGTGKRDWGGFGVVFGWFFSKVRRKSTGFLPTQMLIRGTGGSVTGFFRLRTRFFLVGPTLMDSKVKYEFIGGECKCRRVRRGRCRCIETSRSRSRSRPKGRRSHSLTYRLRPLMRHAAKTAFQEEYPDLKPEDFHFVENDDGLLVPMAVLGNVIMQFDGFTWPMSGAEENCATEEDLADKVRKLNVL